LYEISKKRTPSRQHSFVAGQFKSAERAKAVLGVPGAGATARRADSFGEHQHCIGKVASLQQISQILQIWKHFRTERNHYDIISYLFEGVGSAAELVGQPGQQRSVVLMRRQLTGVQQFEQRPEEGCVDAGRAQLQAYPCTVTRESTQNLKINQPVTALGSVH
jgi:hypothetical protein